MGKIQCVYDMNNNFFFHLMSGSKIGYDNGYGKKYANTVEGKGMATLKKYEKELTMKGGEYDGKLFRTGMYAGNTSEAIKQILFSIEDYYRIEGLAEYYCEELIGKSYNFTAMNKYIDFYRAKMAEKSYSPKELFEAAKGF